VRAAGVGMVVALVVSERESTVQGGTPEVKEIFSNLMQLLAIIMMMVTLAISVAAVSQMMG